MKYFILLFSCFLFSIAQAFGEDAIDDFEAELRLIEKRELITEEAAEKLVEKISEQDNEEELIVDIIGLKKSAISRSPAIVEETSPPKKTRRIPSR